MYFLPGNHDPREVFFPNMFAPSPLRAMNVAFEHGGIQFVCLDWGDQNKAEASVGLFDCLDLNLLQSAAEQPFQAGFGMEFYPTIYDKAACLFFSVCRRTRARSVQIFRIE